MVYGDLFTKKETVPEVVAEPVKKGPPAESAQALMVALISVYEPRERMALLTEGLNYWPEDEALLLLKDFFEKRYKKVDSRIVYADTFLSLLIENFMYAAMSNSSRADKEITKYFEKNPLVNWQKSAQTPELRRELFFGECMQMLGYYVHTCRNDRQYASTFMGLMKAKPERVENKLQSDLNELKEAIDRASASDKFSARWTQEMKVFATALDLFITNF